MNESKNNTKYQRIKVRGRSGGSNSIKSNDEDAEKYEQIELRQ